MHSVVRATARSARTIGGTLPHRPFAVVSSRAMLRAIDSTAAVMGTGATVEAAFSAGSFGGQNGRGAWRGRGENSGGAGLFKKKKGQQNKSTDTEKKYYLEKIVHQSISLKVIEQDVSRHYSHHRVAHE